MNLTHYSNDKLIEPYSVDQQPERHFKPKGLWVSVDGDDDWPSWCQSNEYGIGRYRHRVTLSRDVLVLPTAADVLAFGETYATGDTFRLDWARVAADYPGIIIAPYQWSLRMDWRTDWYYPWDCASGCIWDASAIASVELMDAEVLT